MSFLWSFGQKKEPVTSPIVSQQSFKTMSNTFRKGVQYNMKIVLRGDVMTGKSNLFHRLQGLDFDENRESTPQIQVANIPWHYKDSNDIVKIEIWDVVDKALNKPKSGESKGIILEHTKSKESVEPAQPISPAMDEKGSDESMGLDATTVNVYRNTHGAILLFDTTKPWTFDYVNKELANIPETISVLVLGNFCDKVQERQVEIEKIHAVLYGHNQERIKRGAIKPNLIRYAETSMQSGLGLKYIYEYLGVPFLQLMIESLNKQLELKANEIVDLLETLDTDEGVPDNMQRRRGQDNFNQPSDSTLSRQQEEIKSAWDQELEDIAADHPTILFDKSFQRTETPPPPTAPAKSKKKKDVQLLSEESVTDPIFSLDQSQSLEDDWFGAQDVELPLATIKNESDDEDMFIGNPMVAGDEDVEPTVEYYSQNRHYSYSTNPEKELSTQIDNKEEEEEEDEQELGNHNTVKPNVATYQPPVFKSELNDVWSRDLRRLSSPVVASDSEDEDNMYDNSFKDDFGTIGGGSGYEEIGSSDNPWSIGNSSQPKEPTVVSSFYDEDIDSDPSASTRENLKTPTVEKEEVVETPKKKKSSKKKGSSSTTGGKKKKSSSKS